MRRFGLGAAIVCLSFASPASAETLTNDMIVELAQAGLGDKVLIAKIKASGTEFDTTTKGLLALRKKGVSNAVIAEMIVAAPGPAPRAVGATSAAAIAKAPEPLSATSPDPYVPHPAGVYLLAEWQSPTRMVAIDQVTSSETKSGNLIPYLLTGGLAPMSYRAVIPKPAAEARTPRARPIFYFYFDYARGEGTSPVFWTAGTIVSPAEFNLVRFKPEKATREAQVGRSTLAGAKSGVTEKNRIPFSISQLAPGVFQAQPDEELEEGEYGFLHLSAGGGNGAQIVRVFDFAVDDGRENSSK